MSIFIFFAYFFAHTWCLQRISMKAPRLHLKDIYKQTKKSSPHQKKPSAIAVTIVDFQICQTDFPKLIPFLRLLEAAGDMISPTQPKHWGEIPSKHTWVPPIFFPYRSRHFWVDDLPFPKLGYVFFLRNVSSQESNLMICNDPSTTLTYKPLWIKGPLCRRHLKGSAAIRLYIQGATSLP